MNKEAKITVYNTNSTVREISLKDLILKTGAWSRYLLSKWVFIVIFGLLGGIAGFVYAYYKKPVYIASTSFVLEDNNSNAGMGMLGQYAGLASMAGIDLGSGGGGIFQGENIFELYKSQSMVKKTLLSGITYDGKKELLIDRYITINNLRKEWNKVPQLKDINFNLKPGEQFTRLQDSVLNEAVGDINKKYLFVAKPDKKLSLIVVQVNAKDEVFAKTFNDQIVKNVNDFYAQIRTKKSLENLAILQHQTDSVKTVLYGAINRSAAVTDATPNLNPARQILRAPAQRSVTNAEANKAILTTLVQNLELAKLSLRKETPLIQVVDSPVYPLEKVRTGKAKGIIIGGILFGFLTALFLIIRRVYKNVLTEG